MTIENQISQPQLAPPGAGLPFFEAFMARHIIFPIVSRTRSSEEHLEAFGKTAKNILALCDQLNDEKLFKQILVKRLRGLEDSSRFWSPLMVIHHLLIVGSQVEKGIMDLTEGRVPQEKADTAKVKPSVEINRDVLNSYRLFSENYPAKISPLIRKINPEIRYAHPWFGPLNGRQWIAMNTMHQGIHYQQLLEIIRNNL